MQRTAALVLLAGAALLCGHRAGGIEIAVTLDPAVDVIVAATTSP